MAFHQTYVGAEPSLVGVAVNVTLCPVPVQSAVPGDTLILTVGFGGTAIVMLIVSEGTGVIELHGKLDVTLQTYVMTGACQIGSSVCRTIDAHRHTISFHS